MMSQQSVFTSEDGALLTKGEQAQRVVTNILNDAITKGTSDIHFQPQEHTTIVKFRIDGVLYKQELFELPITEEAQIVSIVKIKAGMKTEERRKQQDGRFSHSIETKKELLTYDIRVSCIPVCRQFDKSQRQSLVLRILDKKRIQVKLDELGFLPDTKIRLEKIIHRKEGLFLSTGPAGSGKTTTLYVLLQMINTNDTHILTIEDPVEYTIDGFDQIAASEHMPFKTALRSFMRHDPNVIMVGEMRDQDTAQIAAEAAMTGHMVISSLHTNNAVATISRLLELNVTKSMIADTLNGVLAQRLARKICPDCKIKASVKLINLMNCFQMHEDEVQKCLEYAEVATENDNVTVWCPRQGGCKTCRNTSYLGRTGIHELLMLDDAIADLIRTNVNIHEIRKAAIQRGNMLRSMTADGLIKMVKGETSPQELARILADS